MSGHGFSCPVCSNPYTLGSGGGRSYDLEPPRPPDPDAEALERQRRTAQFLRRGVGAFLLVVFGLFIASLGHAHGADTGPQIGYNQGRTVLDLILLFK